MKTADFFGLDLSQRTFSVAYHIRQIGLTSKINKNEAVCRLVEKYGLEHKIVSIAKRQQVLKSLKPLINAHLLPYDSVFYVKEITTASEHDRRYDAEEHLLMFCLIIATGEPCYILEKERFIPNIRSLREGLARKRFDRFWDILAENTIDYIHYIKEKKTGENKKKTGFFKKLYNKLDQSRG
ncbi:MAG: hypothetical protein ACWA5R_12680 [bacterium]